MMPHPEPQRRPVFREKSNTPTDLELPEGLENYVVGDASIVQRYRALRDFERKVDAILTNKRLAVKDSAQRYERRSRTMRIWIDCTPAEQTADERMDDTFDFADATGGEFKMRVAGKLLPEADPFSDSDGEDEDQGEMDVDKPAAESPKKQIKMKPGLERTKLSHFFNRITVDFDASQQHGATPSPPPVDWKMPTVTPDGSFQPTREANFDVLNISRKSDEPFLTGVVELHRAEPQGRIRGKLSRPLARLLDREYEDHSGAMMGIYNYIRLRGLEEEGNPQKFRCDDMLRPIFGGRDSHDFIYVPEVVAANIIALPPITLPFKLRLTPGEEPAPPTIYDVQVLADDPLDLFTAHYRRSTNQANAEYVARLQKIAQVDAQIATCVQALRESTAKIDFQREFAADPVGFVRRWVRSQKADMQVIRAEDRANGRGPEWNRGGEEGVWGTSAAKESVAVFLASKNRQPNA
jgi:SWI/SNF-related matrix-associated actin-dependent regulator of chromatin subfamily D